MSEWTIKADGSDEQGFRKFQFWKESGSGSGSGSSGHGHKVDGDILPDELRALANFLNPQLQAAPVETAVASPTLSGIADGTIKPSKLEQLHEWVMGAAEAMDRVAVNQVPGYDEWHFALLDSRGTVVATVTGLDLRNLSVPMLGFEIMSQWRKAAGR